MEILQKKKSLSWILFLWLISEVFGNSKLEVRLEKIESIKGEEETLFELNLKIVGKERSLNGTLKTLDVFDERLLAHGYLFIFKNGDWVQSNLKVDMKGCDFLQSFVSRYYKSVVEHFPNPICPVPVGEYPVIKARHSTENWTFYMALGMSKAEIFLKKIEKWLVV